MVISSRRTYSDAVRWIKSGRPQDLDRMGLAVRIFGGCLATGIVVWGVVAYVSPETLGQQGAKILNLGWPTYLCEALMLGSAAALLLSWRRIAWVARRVKEPYERTLAEDPAYEGAVNALVACARPLQIRFALGWTWGPTLAVSAAVMFAFSAAYIVVYAVLARFEVGWQTYAIAAGDVVAGVGLLAIMASRLRTWRVASSVYRSIILM